MMDSSTLAWKQLLTDAVTKPGLISRAYSRFWRYSIGNQLLALVQCQQRDIEPGPLATFPKWKELGRYVKRGEKALVLCMPITHYRTDMDSETGDEEVTTWQSFMYKPLWFVLSQTRGQALEADPIPGWDRERALQVLEVTQGDFVGLDGNVQGYAQDREFAINPLAAHPAKTMFHELAHIVLGHTAEAAVADTVETPRSLKEVEADSVAMLCLESLGYHGAVYCRGYIQSWLAGDEIPERSAQKIFHAADQILKAGTVEQ